MFTSAAKAQQVNGEPQAQKGERKGTRSAAGRRSQMEGYLKSQGGSEKLDIAQGPNLQPRAGTKGKGHGKITLGKKCWKLFIRYRQRPRMETPRPKSFAFMASCRDQTDKKWPSKNEWCYQDSHIITALLMGEGVQVLHCCFLLHPILIRINNLCSAHQVEKLMQS